MADVPVARRDRGGLGHTARTYDRLEPAFRAAIANETARDGLPAPAALALEDALCRTREALLGATGVLRTGLETDFHPTLAGCRCAYTTRREPAFD